MAKQSITATDKEKTTTVQPCVKNRKLVKFQTPRKNANEHSGKQKQSTKLVNDSTGKAILAQQFKSVFTKSSTTQSSSLHQYPAIKDLDITEKGVEKLKEYKPSVSSRSRQHTQPGPQRMLNTTGKRTDTYIPEISQHRNPTRWLAHSKCGANFQERGQTPGRKLQARLAHISYEQGPGAYHLQPSDGASGQTPYTHPPKSWLPPRILMRDVTGHRTALSMPELWEECANRHSHPWFLKGFPHGTTSKTPRETWKLRHQRLTLSVVHSLPHPTEYEGSGGWKILWPSESRVWCPPRHSSWLTTILMPHKWPTRLCFIASQTLCGRLPTLPENQDPGRPHCPARRLEKNWKPGLKNGAWNSTPRSLT